ncbi:hypothetical protein A2U01_0089609, partial [Trifolium medium]|nr:hypothetical protein [Trifolium medium]
MKLTNEQLQLYNGTLVRLSGEQVEVMGHITLFTTFKKNENTKTVTI